MGSSRQASFPFAFSLPVVDVSFCQVWFDQSKLPSDLPSLRKSSLRVYVVDVPDPMSPAATIYETVISLIVVSILSPAS